MACSKCGSDVLVEGVRVLDRQDMYMAPADLSVRVDREPGAALFKGAVVDELEARVCGGCGLVELYAKHPARLVRAAETRARRGRTPGRPAKGGDAAR